MTTLASIVKQLKAGITAERKGAHRAWVLKSLNSGSGALHRASKPAQAAVCSDSELVYCEMLQSDDELEYGDPSLLHVDQEFSGWAHISGGAHAEDLLSMSEQHSTPSRIGFRRQNQSNLMY